MEKHFFLTRSKNLVSAEIIKETHASRTIEIEDGETKKTIKVHPKGVSWGTQYPRVFSSETKPNHIFSHKGRSIVQTFHDETHKAIPDEEPYRFQPFICDVIDSLHAHENIILTGGTGVGKTTHILQLAARIKQPVLRINFNGETRMSDLVGKFMVLNGETIWIDGVLPNAMRHGYWLLLDELDFAEPAVLSLLHPVLESNPILVLKENGGEIIKPHKGFRVIATANSIGAMQNRANAYSGTNEMNEAFLDRWQVILVDNLPEKEEIKVIKDNVPSINQNIAKKMVNFANKVRNGNLGHDYNYSKDNFSTRKILSWAKKTALHKNPIKGAQLAWLDKFPQDEKEVMLRILHTHFGIAKPKKSASKKVGK